jgi:hypothetical protein
LRAAVPSIAEAVGRVPAAIDAGGAALSVFWLYSVCPSEVSFPITSGIAMGWNVCEGDTVLNPQVIENTASLKLGSFASLLVQQSPMTYQQHDSRETPNRRMCQL